MELITPERRLKLGILIFFCREALQGRRPTNSFTSACKEVPSTNKQDKQQQKNEQDTDKKFTSAVSEGFFTRIHFMALFHCISMRAVQDSIVHQNESHTINFLSQAINWSLINDLFAKLMTGLEKLGKALHSV